MAGVPLYLCPEKLVEVWWQLVADAGCQVEFLQGRNCGQVHCGSATVSVIVEPKVSNLVNEDMHEVTLVFAAPFIGGKNRKLARKIHYLLLGSGAKTYGKFFDSKAVVYQKNSETENLIKALKISNVQYLPMDMQPPVRSGIVRRNKAKVCLLEGPAVDSETGFRTRFFAITPFLFPFFRQQQSDLMCELDARLIHLGARPLSISTP